jgi:hypothetical protein
VFWLTDSFGRLRSFAIAQAGFAASQIIRWRAKGDATSSATSSARRGRDAPVDVRLVVDLEARVSGPWAGARGGTDRTPAAPRHRHGGDDESRREVVRSRGPQAGRAGDEAGRS